MKSSKPIDEPLGSADGYKMQIHTNKRIHTNYAYTSGDQKVLGPT